MSWFTKFLSSSVGQKTVMSLTGLFLVTFLVVHLIGNLQLLYDDGGQQFNDYAYFMTHNPLIKTISYGLYAFILIHAFQGIAIWRQNRAARNNRYAVTTTQTTNFAARSMAWLGILIFIFLLIHMYQFWLQMKIGALDQVASPNLEHEVNNLYAPVYEVFKNPAFVAFYVLSMIVLALHLWHGFQSAFQTLGLNHQKYTPFIKGLGAVYSIVIPLGFAIIPLYFFLFI